MSHFPEVLQTVYPSSCLLMDVNVWARTRLRAISISPGAERQYYHRIWILQSAELTSFLWWGNLSYCQGNPRSSLGQREHTHVQSTFWSPYILTLSERCKHNFVLFYTLYSLYQILPTTLSKKLGINMVYLTIFQSYNVQINNATTYNIQKCIWT